MAKRRSWVEAAWDFTKGSSGMPWHLQVWVTILGGTNLIGGLYFIREVEGQVVLGTFLVSLLLMTAVIKYTGFGRLVGAGHIVWVPMIGYLLWVLSSVEVYQPLHHWLIAIIALDTISLALDAYSTVLYVRGDREDHTPERLFGR